MDAMSNRLVRGPEGKRGGERGNNVEQDWIRKKSRQLV